MLDIFYEFPIPFIIIAACIVAGIVFSIIKKLVKVALFILLVGVLLFIALKLFMWVLEL
ncbi:MAG: hypothetical protein FWG85_03025 [Bacteroidetes bacterium]|nr:hypothetical protein [Bacteroidota bacterium]